MAYGYEQTRKWRKMGYLNEKGLLKEEGQLISEGLITDEEVINDYGKKLETIRILREEFCVRHKHAKEAANEIKVKNDVNEAIEWLRFHKEKDWSIAEKGKAKRDAGETHEVQEESDVEEGVEIYECEPMRLGGGGTGGAAVFVRALYSFFVMPWCSFVACADWLLISPLFEYW